MRSKVVLRYQAALLVAFLFLSATFAGVPAPSSAARDPLAFAVIGDSGTGETPQFDIARQMKAQRETLRFDFVLMLGDNIYPDGREAYFKPKFEEPYRELLKDGVKFYAVLGNHDARSGIEAQTHYGKFNMDGNRYYNFSKGNDLIEFFALDSTDMDNKQLSWIDKKLGESKALWKIAYFHHPLYSSGKFHGSDKTLRAQLEPLFVRHKVDAVFAGHDHVYERVKPQQGIYYFTEGASGQLRKGNLNRRTPFFDTGNDAMQSFLLVEANETQIKVAAIGINGSTLDSLIIHKKKE